MIGYLNWLPDSRHLLYYLLGENEGLHVVNLEGSEPQKIEIETARLRNLRIHPDGKQIIYSGGSRKYEVWTMDNYLQ